MTFIPPAVSPAVSPVTSPLPDLLVVDGSADASSYTSVLRGSYRVLTTTSPEVAKQFLHRNRPSLVVADLDRTDGDGLLVCREAKLLGSPPPVLVTTSNAEQVPDALVAGCDAVLLKPFAPNLLYARVGRLLRANSETLRARARNSLLRSAHLLERSEAARSGSNQVWPNTHCPYCDHEGVTSFEFCSHRR